MIKIKSRSWSSRLRYDLDDYDSAHVWVCTQQLQSYVQNTVLNMHLDRLYNIPHFQKKMDYSTYRNQKNHYVVHHLLFPTTIKTTQTLNYQTAMKLPILMCSGVKSTRILLSSKSFVIDKKNQNQIKFFIILAVLRRSV